MARTPQDVVAPTKDLLVAALTIVAFCARYGVSRTRVWGEIAAGRIPARKAGRNTLISVEDGDKWFASLEPWKPTGGPRRRANTLPKAG